MYAVLPVPVGPTNRQCLLLRTSWSINDVGVLSVSWDGSGVQQVAPGDPLELGLVKGEAVDSFALWEDLGNLDRSCLQTSEAMSAEHVQLLY